MTFIMALETIRPKSSSICRSDLPTSVELTTVVSSLRLQCNSFSQRFAVELLSIRGLRTGDSLLL